MNNVIINRGNGGLGRQPVGQDYISGFVFYGSSGTLSALGWTSGAVKKFGGIADAIAAGITNTHVGETKATATLTCGVGTAGHIVKITVTNPKTKAVTVLCTYTEVSGDATDTVFATNLTAAINAQTYLTGFTATASTDTVVISAAPGLGVTLNSGTPISLSGTGAADVTITDQFTSGVGSEVDNYYYHINRYFTQSPNATLYVSLTTTPSWSGYAFGEIGLIQTAANGAIRQCGVFVPTTFATAMVTAMQAEVATLITNDQPLSVIMGADFSSTTAAALNNLATLNSEHISVSVGQDGAAQGNTLFLAAGYSITQVGDVLGLVSRSQVSDDIAWVSTYTLSPDGIENAVPAFATGELLSALSAGTINGVDAYRYIFGRQFVNDSPNGTFVNDSHCATAYTSDYAYIENNRVIDKAARLSYAAYIAALNGPLIVKANGTLTNAQVAYFTGIGETALAGMAANNPNTNRPEISGYAVTVNPNQNVLTTSELVVSIAIQPVGVARQIIINLQFTVSIQ